MEATLDQGTKILSIFKNTPIEQVQAILGSGLLADLRDGNIVEINRDSFRKALGLKPLNAPVELLLDLAGSTVTIPPTKGPFVARKHFVADTSRKAKVKISYLGDNFCLWFLDKVEEPFIGSELRYGRLRKLSVDAPIIAELGGEEKAETTLTELRQALEKQPNGKMGDLLIDGCANIFYIRDVNGVLRAVHAHWRGGGWRVFAYSVEGPGGWSGGFRVFSRNSVS
jgi:hypothetical protein